MLMKAYLTKEGLYIPGFQLSLDKKEVWVNIEVIDGKIEKETKKAIIEHCEEEKKKETPINSEIIEEMAQKLGLKGISLEDLINDEF